MDSHPHQPCETAAAGRPTTSAWDTVQTLNFFQARGLLARACTLWVILEQLFQLYMVRVVCPSIGYDEVSLLTFQISFVLFTFILCSSAIFSGDTCRHNAAGN